MNKLFGVFLLCYICLVAFLVIDAGADEKSQRPKRYLSFPNITRFFLKINFKANMVPWNQFFAQALGFRINWDDPPDSFHAYPRFKRRAVYSHIEMLLDRNGLNGFHCIRRAICEMETISDSDETYHKILNIVFRNKSPATSKWHYVTPGDCRLSILSCPLSVLDVSRFTDIL